MERSNKLTYTCLEETLHTFTLLSSILNNAAMLLNFGFSLRRLRLPALAILSWLMML